MIRTVGTIRVHIVLYLIRICKDRTELEFYPPVENLLDLIYEHYTENNPAAPKTTVVGRAAKEKEKELERWLRGLDGMCMKFPVIRWDM